MYVNLEYERKNFDDCKEIFFKIENNFLIIFFDKTIFLTSIDVVSEDEEKKRPK